MFGNRERDAQIKMLISNIDQLHKITNFLSERLGYAEERVKILEGGNGKR